MGYPFILAYNDEQFARVNHDGSWSVHWGKALDVRYDTLTVRNKAIIACAIVLVAAKDNFRLTSWEQSDAWHDKWTHNPDKPKVIDVRNTNSCENETEFNISKAKEPLARVNSDGSWSIMWEPVQQITQMPPANWRMIALNSFCHLLMAGHKLSRSPVE